MKKAFKILLYLLGAVAVLVIVAVSYVYFKGIPNYGPQQIPEFNISPTPEKIEEGARISAMLCSHCHMGKDGKLSGGLMRDLDPAFGKAYVANITNHPTYGIGSWTSSELAYFLRTGVRKDGRYAPPWMPKFGKLSDADLEAIISYLKSDAAVLQASEVVHPERQPSLLAKFLCQTAFKPLPYPTQPVIAPDTTDKVAYGRYMVHGKVECFTCHSADFKKMDIFVPENSLGYMGGGNLLIDLEGRPIYSANITMDKETGIGNWTLEEFKAALKESRRPDGKSLRYPMLPLGNMKDFEVEAIWEYLKTVPVIQNKVDRTGL